MTSTILTIKPTTADSTAVGNQERLIKTDRIGRIHVKPELREALLDKFEQCAMSGLQFAKLHGIKYPTFANWRQQRRIKLNDYSVITTEAPAELVDSLAEVVIGSQPSGSESSSSHLKVDLGGGLSLNIQAEADLGFAVKLINQLRQDVSL